jgi:DNA-directed RNA polymerase specialized sigma24 family protein
VTIEPAHESVPAPDPQGVPDSHGRMESGMAQLPVEQRNLLELRLRERASYEDLARQSNTSVGAVKSRLYRARENLKGILLAEEPK